MISVYLGFCWLAGTLHAQVAASTLPEMLLECVIMHVSKESLVSAAFQLIRHVPVTDASSKIVYRQQAHLMQCPFSRAVTNCAEPEQVHKLYTAALTVLAEYSKDVAMVEVALQAVISAVAIDGETCVCACA